MIIPVRLFLTGSRAVLIKPTTKRLLLRLSVPKQRCMTYPVLRLSFWGWTDAMPCDPPLRRWHLLLQLNSSGDIQFGRPTPLGEYLCTLDSRVFCDAMTCMFMF
jgi:hypothetical protein